jgi:hypothetical protein
MSNYESSKPNDTKRFSLCPQCGRKGMYYIKQKYQRCRYCGTYRISPNEKQEQIEPEQSALPVETG